MVRTRNAHGVAIFDFYPTWRICRVRANMARSRSGVVSVAGDTVAVVETGGARIGPFIKRTGRAGIGLCEGVRE